MHDQQRAYEPVTGNDCSVCSVKHAVELYGICVCPRQHAYSCTSMPASWPEIAAVLPTSCWSRPLAAMCPLNHSPHTNGHFLTPTVVVRVCMKPTELLYACTPTLPTRKVQHAALKFHALEAARRM